MSVRGRAHPDELPDSPPQLPLDLPAARAGVAPSAGSTASTASTRKRRGDYPTPGWLVDATVAGVLPTLRAMSDPVRVLDPACGDGRFLVAAARWLRARGQRVSVHGCDIAPDAIAAARRRITDELGPDVAVGELTVADALQRRWDGEFDVIVGNPPYLSQLAADTTRGAASARGGGPYADVAAEFVALAADLVAPGGVIGLVLPQSLLASRDAAAIRAAVDRRCARVWSWWSPQQVFDAAVVVCALGWRRRPEANVAASATAPVAAPTPVPTTVLAPSSAFVPGPVTAAEPADDPASSWTDVITGVLGVPRMPSLATDGALGSRLRASVEFRGVFYALADATVDDADRRVGPPLVTTGMIDPWALGWGAGETRVNKRRFRHPRVVIARLDASMQRWAAEQLVPKLLVANQCRVVEAVVDAAGELLPSVPVLSIRPRRLLAGEASSTGELFDEADTAVEAAVPAPDASPGASAPDDELLWATATVLASPIATIALWQRQAGTGLSGRVIRLTPAALEAVPWPAGDLLGASAYARAGEHDAAVRAVLAAYGLAATTVEELLVWHASWSARGAFRRRGSQTEPR